MGTRFRKSKKIAPGVRVTVGKKSGSVSFGTKGVRHTVSSTGRSTTTVGIPGTGIYSASTSGAKKSKPSGAPCASDEYVSPSGSWRDIEIPVSALEREEEPAKKPPHSARTYRVCGVVSFVFAALLALTAFAFWPMIFFGVLLSLLGGFYFKTAKAAEAAVEPTNEKEPEA